MAATTINVVNKFFQAICPFQRLHRKLGYKKMVSTAPTKLLFQSNLEFTGTNCFSADNFLMYRVFNKYHKINAVLTIPCSYGQSKLNPILVKPYCS